MEAAKKIALSNRQLKFEKQESGALGTISLRGGSYLGKPAAWWLLFFVNDKFCHGFVDFQLDRDQRPLWQLRQVRQILVAKYGEPLIDEDSHPHSDPSWEDCLKVKPAFKCEWKQTTSGPNPEATTVRLFMHGSKMESACMRLVLGQDVLGKIRDKLDHDLKSGAATPDTAASAEDLQAREVTVKEAFGKFHSAVKAGKGKLALEMRNKESLGRMTEEQKAVWLRMRPNRNEAPSVLSVSLRSKTAGVYYALKDSRGRLTYSFDLFLMEDGQWKLHTTRDQDHPPGDLDKSFWLPPDTAPFIEGGEDWSKVEAVPTGDPDWSVQAASDPVFLYIRFIHTTDLPLPGSPGTTNDLREANLIYTPGVSIGVPNIQDGIRFSVGEVIGTRTAKPKNQSFVDYSFTFRRKGDESHSENVEGSSGILRILGRWVDIRIPREVLTGIPAKPLRIWVIPKAPAATLEYAVKEWHRPTEHAALTKVTDKEKENEKFVRLAAVQDSTNQVALVNMVINEKELSVRVAALKKVTDQVLLAQLATDDKVKWSHLNPVLNLTNQTLLAKVAVEAKEGRIRLAAIKKLDDQTQLVKVAAEDKEWLLRKTAFERISDPAALATLADNATNACVQLAARIRVGKIPKNEALSQVAAGTRSAQDVMGALKLFESKDSLTKAAEEIGHACIRKGEAARVPDLVELLNQYGTKSLAEDYLNCGQSDLKLAAQSWLKRRKVRISEGNEPPRARWGEGK